MDWSLKTFEQLSTHELYQILKARVDVFVVEQACAYEEIDNYDQQLTHLFLNNQDKLAAYVRLVPKQTKFKEVSIDRVIDVKEFRGKEYAKAIMQKAINHLIKKWREKLIKIQ